MKYISLHMQKSCMPQLSHPKTGNFISHWQTGSNIPLLLSLMLELVWQLLTWSFFFFFSCFTVQLRFVLIYGQNSMLEVFILRFLFSDSLFLFGFGTVRWCHLSWWVCCLFLQTLYSHGQLCHLHWVLGQTYFLKWSCNFRITRVYCIFFAFSLKVKHFSSLKNHSGDNYVGKKTILPNNEFILGCVDNNLLEYFSISPPPHLS